MSESPTLLFAIMALHYIAQAEAGLDSTEVVGLKMILEAEVIARREDND